MCQTIDDVTKPCVAHTRPNYQALVEAMDAQAKKAPFGKEAARKKARQTFTCAGGNAVNVLADHATVPGGAKDINREIERYKTEGDNQSVNVLRAALAKGKQRLATVKEAQSAKVKADRAARNSMSTLKANTTVSFDRSLAGRYPVLAAMWDTEKNDGISPEQVAGKANVGVWLRCSHGHSIFGRLNNYANAMDRGQKPHCNDCQPRRAAAFKATQEDLTTLVDALGGDPAAFRTLTPATQYALMGQMGLLSGGADSMNRNVAMSIVHGDLTLTDVVRAADLAAVDKRVRDNLDDENTLCALGDTNLTDSGADRIADLDDSHALLDVNQALDATGALDLIDEDSDTYRNLTRELTEYLWNHACRPGVDADGFVDYLTAQYGKTGTRDRILDAFLADFHAVRNTPLPTGYNPDRIDEHGQSLTINPTLAQRRFAHLVASRRRFMNWSGTGAGKTLSASLSIQATGARETLVVCPKAVRHQWKREFEQGFPGMVEVHLGLPTAGEALPPLTEGVNRVWVANYDLFSGAARTVQARLANLADQVDAIVFDEIHKAKTSTKATASQRRRNLEKFTDRAGETNETLVVIGASATPVVNNLDEAKSVLRLVEGPGSRGFATTPTIRNAVAAHQRLAASGIRHMPVYKTRLTRTNKVIDITDRLAEIHGRVEQARTQQENGRVHPAVMERALLSEKVPALVEMVRANTDNGEGPTLIYTHYIEEMVDPIRDALTAEGLRVGVFTGAESDAERKQVLDQFRNGGLDALIGSEPIATGVDGLQHSASHLIVVSMPWTAAADDQLVGRLQRHGQVNNVTVTYLITEAKMGKAHWSWCKDHRQKRVHFKRDIANAAVDGVLPEGVMESNQKSAEEAVAHLAALTKAQITLAA